MGKEAVKIALPQVNYSIVDPSALIPANVQDKQAIAFGFNSGLDWEYGNEDSAGIADNDGRYIRWLQPMESVLSTQVEYDMDEQDQAWLDIVNRSRTKDGNAVSSETFEIIFDKLEKEWFDLTKSIPKKESALPAEDSKCAICDDAECDNSNAIVFCDGCNLAVHQDCYGVPYIPEGQWLCRKCTVLPDKPVSCVLCPNSYGAFKQTTTSQWAHLLCAIWVPDTGVSNTVYMEPIDGVENISRSRWKLNCFLCRKKVGACIQCAKSNCFTAFHVTCARERGLELKMKSGSGAGEMRAYCDKHSSSLTPSDSYNLMKRPKVKLKSGNSCFLKTGGQNTGKSARAYKQTYSTGPPLIPAYIFDRLMEYTTKIKMPKRSHFISLVCRYWSLKRESRRGAPLLKRLHLEPWTATASFRHNTDNERVKKLELIKLLRKDLEQVRMLTERVGKRERKKLERVALFKSVIDDFVFPKDASMRDGLRRIILLDKNLVFTQPVSRALVPDYHDVIKFPMDWSAMSDKLDRHEYLSTAEFRGDVDLVLGNCRMYNRSDTLVHKIAIKLGEAAVPILDELDHIDDIKSDQHQRAIELIESLTDEAVENLFEYNLPDPNDEPLSPEPVSEPFIPLLPSATKPPVSPTAVKITTPKSKSKKKKRSATTAQLDSTSGPLTFVPEVPLVDSPIEPPRHRAQPRATANNILDPSLASPLKKLKITRHTPSALSPLATIDVPSSSTSSIADSASRKSGKPDKPEKKHRSKNMVKFKGAEVAQVASLPNASSLLPNPIISATRVPLPTLIKLRPDASTSRLSSKIQAMIVPDVDAQASFKLFETGWVLPEGTSRRKSVHLSVSPLLPTAVIAVSSALAQGPPSRKGKEKAVVEGPLAPLAPLYPSGSKASPRRVDESVHFLPPHLDVDMADVDMADVMKFVEADVEDEEERGEDESEDIKAVEQALSGNLLNVQPKTKQAREERKMGKKPKKVKKEAALIMLKKDWDDRVKTLSLLPQVDVTDRTNTEDGLLVWAKYNAFAPFPAEVADPSDLEGTPQDLVKRKPTGEGTENHVLVLFFDERRTGAWIPRKHLKQLGENKEFDQLLQSPLATFKAGSTKTSHNSQASQRTIAYLQAIESTSPDADLTQAMQGSDASTQTKAITKRPRNRKANTK